MVGAIDNLRLKRLWRNEYFRFLVFAVIILASLTSFWFGSVFILKTDHPYLTVSSGSMCRRGIETAHSTTNCDGFTCIFYPTLHIGDLIVVKGGLDPSEIKAAPYPEGDIIVFRSPNNPEILVVHRAVDKKYENGHWVFTTQGDGLLRTDRWVKKLTEEYIVGKVIFRIPLLGHIPLFLHTPLGNAVYILVLAFLVILLVWDLISPIILSREETSEDSEGKT